MMILLGMRKKGKSIEDSEQKEVRKRTKMI
jgi:hypothetical protein